MATTTAWTSLYQHVLTQRLGLEVDVTDIPAAGALAYLKVRTGAGWIFGFCSDPDTRPHYLQIRFGMAYGDHTDVLTASPQLMTQLCHRFTLEADAVKVVPRSATACSYLVETYLAAPGALPDPDLLTALVPAWVTALIETHRAVRTEIEAAALYTAQPGD